MHSFQTFFHRLGGGGLLLKTQHAAAFGPQHKASKKGAPSPTHVEIEVALRGAKSRSIVKGLFKPTSLRISCSFPVRGVNLLGLLDGPLIQNIPVEFSIGHRREPACDIRSYHISFISYIIYHTSYIIPKHGTSNPKMTFPPNQGIAHQIIA